MTGSVPVPEEAPRLQGRDRARRQAGEHAVDRRLRAGERLRLLDRFDELLAAELPAVRYTPAEGTYLAWLDCRELGLGDDPAKAFLKQGRVALNSGIPFGTGGAGFVRMNLATSPEIITEAVRRMGLAR